MAESAYPQCPQGHEFAQNGGAIKIQTMGTRDLELIAGWTLIYCRRCGHVFQFAAPGKP